MRSDRRDLIEALAPLVHQPTWLRVAAERAVSRAMGGSCSMPLAAFANWQDDSLLLEAAWGDVVGKLPLVRLRAQAQVTDQETAARLGQQVAADLKAQVLAQGGTLTPEPSAA